MSVPIPVAFTSQSVCRSCRIGKQRCDKSLPTCSRCVSKLLRCNYDRADTSKQFDCQPSPEPAIVEHRLCCFELSDHSARQLVDAARTNNNNFILARILSEILDAAQIPVTSLLDEYFTTIHTWLPIIDQGHFRSRLPCWPKTHDAEMSALMWSIYLITRRPCMEEKHSTNTLLYRTIKQIFMLLATENSTLELLQAGLLIAHYACGHGLPRDAFVVLATCVTIARLLGLEFVGMHVPTKHNSELSACRWAIFLLDRTVALSSVPNPILLVLPPHICSKTTEHPISFLVASELKRSFDISSRVALLIGTALSYINDPQLSSIAGFTYSDTYNQVEELVRELVYRTKTGLDSYLYCESTSLAVSTLLALQITSSHASKPEPNSKESLLLQSTMRMIQENIRMSTYLLQEGNGCGISIVALCALARAAATLVRACGRELARKDLDMLCDNLRRFAARWAVCRKYLEHIDKILE